MNFSIDQQSEKKVLLLLCLIFFFVVTALEINIRAQTQSDIQPVKPTFAPNQFSIKIPEQQSKKQEKKVVVEQDQNSFPPADLFKFYAGEIHYSRIPFEYWEHRIQMIKAMGLNALSVYVMWNHHEVDRGVFDYETENKNLDKFLNLAEKHQMKVLFRPGPYVCAEWDFGGFPARLYSIPNLRVRQNNKKYLEEVKIYFQSLVPIINKHLRTRQNPKGSIILLQIQNQYGSFGSDPAYIQALRNMWIDLKIKCQLYHEDGPYEMRKSHLDGLHIGLSNGIKKGDYVQARNLQKKGMIFGGQIYTGWLTHWGEPKWQSVSISQNINQYQFLLSNNISFSMYMAHGGTNFGLSAGANDMKRPGTDYSPHITSYDYDSPINEQGGATQKYKQLRKLISKYAPWKIPEIPKPIPTIAIPKIKINPVASLMSYIESPIIQKSEQTYKFESPQLKMFNQGFVIYETTLEAKKYNFRTVVRDFGIVVLDGQFLLILDRSITTKQSFSVNCQKKEGCNMKIVVQAMGHINYDQLLASDRKGLFDFTDQYSSVFKWNIYKVEIDQKILKWDKLKIQNKLPTLFKGEFEVSKIGDTFLDTTQLTKGYLFVNGRNLGRYWNKGPQKRLFCPGVWLKEGKNTIQVLQLLFESQSKNIEGFEMLK